MWDNNAVGFVLGILIFLVVLWGLYWLFKGTFRDGGPPKRGKR